LDTANIDSGARFETVTLCETELVAWSLSVTLSVTVWVPGCE
jgi:hypothetical protein